jgi:hypothetical protein
LKPFKNLAEKIKMTRKNKLNYEEWGRRLESGDRSESLLDLASRVQDLYTPSDNPSAAFEKNLRVRLLDRFTTDPKFSFAPPRRLLAWGLTLLAVLTLTILVLQLLPGSVPTVSAAEIFERASLRLSERLAANDVIYDRIIMDWHKGGFQRDNVVAELWRTADGSHLRYQMYDENDLLYYDQHDDESLWRSSYVRPVYGNVIDFVYQAPYIPEHAYMKMEDKQLVAQLLFRDLSTFWSNIDQMVSGERADCAGLFCALSSIGQGWDCSDNKCTLNLGPVFLAENLIIYAEVSGQSYLKDGQEVYEVRTYLPEVGDQWYTILKFDTTTYDLLEIEDYSHGKLQYRIHLVERQILTWADLPDNFFRTIPEGIEVRSWESDIPLGHREDDYAWIISADPPQGASLSGVVTVSVEIGYRLVSIERAKVGLSLAWAGHDYMESIKYDKVPVKGGEGTVQISFSVDADQLGEGMWAVRPIFFDTMGIDTAWNGGVTPQEILLEYCVRCTSEP